MYFCKLIAVGVSIVFIAAFSLEANIKLKIIIKQQKGQKFFSTRFYARVGRIRPTTRVGKNRAFASRSFQASFLKKLAAKLEPVGLIVVYVCW